MLRFEQLDAHYFGALNKSSTKSIVQILSKLNQLMTSLANIYSYSLAKV